MSDDPSGKSGSAVHQQVLAAIEKQFEDAEERRQDHRFPASVVGAVVSAAQAAKAAITPLAYTGEKLYQADCVEVLERAREKYRRTAEDEDGYGSATLAEIIRDVAGIVARG